MMAMSKIAIIYKSKSGYTKKYADWLAEKTGGDVFCGNVKIADLMKYDTIIYGGGLYAGKINGVKLITKNFETLKGKKIIVFCVCLSALTQNIIDQIRKGNFTDDMDIQFFMLRGGFDFAKCTFIDKILMRILRKMIQSKKELTNDDKGMLASFDKPLDLTNSKNLSPILDCLNEE